MNKKEKTAYYDKFTHVECELNRLREEADRKDQYTRVMALGHIIDELREGMKILRGDK